MVVPKPNFSKCLKIMKVNNNKLLETKKYTLNKTLAILIFIGGIIQIVVSSLCIGIFLTGVVGSNWHIPYDPGPVVVLAIYFGPLLLTGLIAIMGGICTLQRRRWILSLFGSFTSYIPFAMSLILVTDWRFFGIEQIGLYILPVLVGIILMILSVRIKKNYEEN